MDDSAGAMSLQDIAQRLEQLEDAVGLPAGRDETRTRGMRSLTDEARALRSRLSGTDVLDEGKYSELLDSIAHFLVSSSRAGSGENELRASHKLSTILAAEERLLRCAAQLAKVSELCGRGGVTGIPAGADRETQDAWGRTCDEVAATYRDRRSDIAELLRDVTAMGKAQNIIMGSIDIQFARWNEALSAWEERIAAAEAQQE